MKFSYLFLVVLLLLNSCSNNEEAIEVQDITIDTFPQKWKLVKMTGSIQGSESTGEEMSWQENYIFNLDGSFVKTRIINGETSSAEGQYTFQEEEESFILNFNNENPLIGNCSSESMEHLYFDGSYLLSSWWACDGPGLFYERIE